MYVHATLYTIFAMFLHSYCTGLCVYSAVSMLLESPVYAGADARRPEYKACALGHLQYFADSLATAAADTQSGEVRKAAIHAMKEVGQAYTHTYTCHNYDPYHIYAVYYMYV